MKKEGGGVHTYTLVVVAKWRDRDLVDTTRRRVVDSGRLARRRRLRRPSRVLSHQRMGQDPQDAPTQRQVGQGKRQPN